MQGAQEDDAVKGRMYIWWLLRAAFCLGVLAVAWLSLVPQMPIPQGIHIGDKIGHGLAYAALAFTATALMTPRTKLALGTAVLAFGIAMELAQGAVPGRTQELADVGANIVGMLLGIFCALLLERLLNRLRPRSPAPA